LAKTTAPIGGYLCSGLQQRWAVGRSQAEGCMRDDSPGLKIGFTGFEKDVAHWSQKEKTLYT
jgi:hypothetical protein